LAPVRRDFDAGGLDGDHAARYAGHARFAEQTLNGVFRPVVLALAELMLTNASPRVDEIERRPVVVVEGAPDCVVAVERDRVLDAHLSRSPTDVLDIALESKLRRMDADHDQPLPILLRPGAHIRQRAQPVDARVGPELDQHDFAAQGVRCQRW
jgi:hypothetical protein